LGVPVMLGSQGVEKILEIALTSEENNNLMVSIKAVEDILSDLKRLNFIL